MSDDLLGQMLGPYEVIDTIGFEGPAEVYRGYLREAGKQVLIRLVGRGLEPNAVWSARFRREGRAVVMLKHANIAPAYDFGEALDGHYMISEIVDGTPLTDILAQAKAGNHALLPDDITFMIRQVAAALDYAHSQGVTHRNLTPDHIMITRSGQAIVADFGLMMLLSRCAEEQSGGAHFDSVNYMAPEVLEDFLSATHASDIYSLGVILYHILTGELPYQTGSEVDDALRALTGSAPNPRLLNEEIPVTVADVVLKALSISPKDRFRNAMQMAAQLEWAYANPVPPPSAPRPRKAPRPVSEPGDLVTDGPLSSPRRPTAERLVVKRGMSRQEERREKARLRAEHERIRREDNVQTRAQRREEARLKAQARRQQWRAFWARWGRTLATTAVVLVVLLGILFGLQATGLLAVAVKPPELPRLPTSAGPTPTSTPFDPNVTVESLATIKPQVLAPTPIQPTQTPIAPVQRASLGIGTTAFRVHDGALMQFVPAGQFMMGTDDPSRHLNAHPQHPVMVSDYWIDQTEVTNAQYALCTDEGLCQPPTKRVYFDNPTYTDYPVTFVTYEQAGTYCLWLASASGQVIGLPTEAQWEKAAAWDPAAGTARVYPWGNEPPTAERGRFFGGPETRPASPVGSHPAGASAYGVQDMAGNVWEWVADWFNEDYYKRTGVAIDPIGPPAGTHRVARGGSWSAEGYMATSSFRNPTQPTVNGETIGFRCAMTASRPPAESGVVLTALDASQMLAAVVEQSKADTENDTDAMSQWQTVFSDLNTALSGGDRQKALGIVVESTQRLSNHVEDQLVTSALASRLSRGLAWIQEQLSTIEE